MEDPYRTPTERNQELQAWFYWSPERWRAWQVVTVALLGLVGGILHAAGFTYREHADSVRAEVQAAEYAAKHPAPPTPCADTLYELAWHFTVVCAPNQKLTLTGSYAMCICK
jgi:hypothetical protein